MDPVDIDSIEGRTLRLSTKHPRHADEIWAHDAALSIESGSLAMKVWDRGSVLAEFFRSLAEDWRGFDGRREFVTLEGELGMTARVDGPGHIELEVTLRHAAPPAWSPTATLILGRSAHDQLSAPDLPVRSAWPAGGSDVVVESGVRAKPRYVWIGARALLRRA